MFMPGVMFTGLTVEPEVLAAGLQAHLMACGKLRGSEAIHIERNYGEKGTVIGFPMTTEEYVAWGCVVSAFLFDAFTIQEADEGNEFLTTTMAEQKPMAGVGIAALWISDNGKPWIDASRYGVPTKHTAALN
jgi:hypothetical protein